MKIRFERSGGFTGIGLSTTLDSESLAPEEAEKLQRLIEAAHFFDLPAKMVASPPGADQFQYRLTIESAEKQHTVEASDTAAPETLQQLFRRLTVLARSAPRS